MPTKPQPHQQPIINRNTMAITPRTPVHSGVWGRSHPEAFCAECGGTAARTTPYACKKHPEAVKP